MLKIATVLFLITFTVATNAQAQPNLTLLPSCAELCMGALSNGSICVPMDPLCICNNEQALKLVNTCVQSTCTVVEQLSAKNITQTLCGAPVRDRTMLISGFGLGGGVVATLAFALRLFSRVKSKATSCGMDDYIMALAMLAILPFSGLSIVLAHNGLGKDIWTLQPEQITRVLYVYYIDESLYLASTALTKISILYFYLRIFPDRFFRGATLALVSSCMAYQIAFILVSVFQCRPISAAWEHWDGEHPGSCNNVNIQGWTCAVINIVLDVCILLLPMPQLSTLSMSLGRKARLLAVFGVGVFVTLVSILRLESLINFAKSRNPTWDYVPMGYWSTIEVHTGVVCACMPAISSLIFKRAQTPARNGENCGANRAPRGEGKQDSSVHITQASLELELISRFSDDTV
ncbi:putative integral membrane protein [Macrophomina phaseolina]|uniref:Integral membrane protein n=1 Tax=Macrophomina phaseolina TaxID=35725 RepID=A0ABQ8FRI4_9PEZI|nr:putative integral membrane protein [Macrophomina phaseolina]